MKGEHQCNENFPGTLAELLREYNQMQREVEEAKKRLEELDEKVANILKRNSDDGK